MSLENLRQSFDQRNTSLSAFDQFMTDGDPTPVGTVGGQDTSGDLSLGAAIGTGAFTLGAASFTWKSYMTMQALAPKPDVWDNFIGVGKKVNLKTAAERMNGAADVVKLMEALPGAVGTTVKRLPFDALFKELEKAIDALDPAKLAMETAILRMDVAQAKAWEASKTTFAVSATVTGLGLVGTGIATAYAAKSDEFLDEDGDTTTGYSSLVDSAFTEFGMRSDISLGDLDGAIDKVDDFVKNLPDIEALAKLMASIDEIAKPLKSLIADISGLVEPYGAFLTAVDVIASPLDPVFAFFSNPPNLKPVFGTIKTCLPFTDICTEVPNPIPEKFVDLFTPIPKSAIQKIIDAITSFSDKIGAVFDKAFGVILKPIEGIIEKVLQPVLEKLNPFTDYIDDFSIASDILSELRGLLDTIVNKFEEMVGLLPDIDIDLSPVKEIGVFEEAGMSMFLGQEADETLKGVKSVSTDSVMRGAILQGNGGDDDVTGTDENDLLGGGTGDDVIDGLAGDDVIYGDEGNDTIDGGSGSDVINGGQGFDTALYLDENFDQFVFSQDGNEIQVARKSAPEVDYVTGVEALQFKDQTIKVTDLFPDITTDPVSDIPAPDVQAIDGSNLNDVLGSGAGRAAFMSGGGGADVFEFKSETANGAKEIDVVEDFALNEDLIRLTQSDVAEVRQTGGGVVLILEDDGDAIYLRNDALDLQDLSAILEIA